MAKLLLIPTILLLFWFHVLTCSATVYTVGDNAGWDISTNLDSWSQDKAFKVGDTLLFQYSQYHSVSEVTKENYEGCNTTNALQLSRNGNTSFALTSPGDRYFVCGNKLHCLGGMKLHVNVLGKDQALSPAGAPQAQPGGALPPGSAKTNSPPNSSALNPSRRIDSLVLALFGSLVVLLGLM